MRSTLVAIAYGIFLLLAGACKKNSDECAGLRTGIEKEEVKADDQYMQPYRKGDTLSFKAYSRTALDSTHYDYKHIGTIDLVATDSFREEVYQPKALYSRCEASQYISVHQIIRFAGDDSLLTVRLMPLNLEGAELGVYFGNKEFRTNSFLLNRGDSLVCKPSMQVGGVWYDQVNLLKGYDAGQLYNKNYYTDSTYAFYTANQGIIRMIINDTLVFEKH